jgi:hypothetical protein
MKQLSYTATPHLRLLDDIQSNFIFHGLANLQSISPPYINFCAFLRFVRSDHTFKILKTFQQELILGFMSFFCCPFPLHFATSFSYSFSASSLIFASRHIQAGHKGERNVTDRLQTQTYSSSGLFLEPENSSFMT